MKLITQLSERGSFDALKSIRFLNPNAIRMQM